MNLLLSRSVPGASWFAAVVLLFVGGCSDRERTDTDAGVHAELDGSHVDDGGTRREVWHADDQGFAFRSAGGLPFESPDGGCDGHDIVIRFTAPSSLVSEGCASGVGADWSVELNDSQQQQLLGWLYALRTTKTTWCTADAWYENLTVYDSTGATHEYGSSINFGCSSEPPPGTMLIDYTDFPGNQFRSFLFSLRPAADGG